jgi:cardiolipin synthase (CMP-forming)
MSWKIIPNILTTLRILLLVPIVCALLAAHYSAAFYLFMIAGLSDCFDGLLARRFQWTSRYGAIADPIADKLLLMSSFITLSYIGYLPIWLIGIVISRDIWILTGAIAYHFLIREPDFVPSQISKFNTFFQILLIGTLLFDLGIFKVPLILFQPLLFIVAFMSILSLIDYSWIWGLRAWRIKKGLYCA